MVKFLSMSKNHGKLSKIKRISKKIKFIRHSHTKRSISDAHTDKKTSEDSNDSNPPNDLCETEKCIKLSLINWTYIFLEEIKCPKRKSKEFIRDFINIIKKLNMTENEFILWILYIEYYNKISCIQESWDVETLFYISLHAKEILGIKTDINSSQEGNNEKLCKLKHILEEKNFNIIELNQKYNFYYNFYHKNQSIYYDLNSMVKYICDSNNCKNTKKIKKENIPNEKKEIDIKVNDTIYKIDNNQGESEKVSVDSKNNDDLRDDHSISIMEVNRYDYDKQQLPVGEEFMKLGSSYENLKMDIESLFYINQ